MKRIFFVTFVLIVIYLLVRNSQIYSDIATKSASYFRSALGTLTQG